MSIPKAGSTPENVSPAKRIGGIFLGMVCFAAFLAACSDSPPVENLPPEIDQLLPDTQMLVLGQSTRIVALAGDGNGDKLTYAWSADAGTLTRADSMVTTWTAPQKHGLFTVRLDVSDGKFVVSDSLQMSVGQGTISVTSEPPGVRITLDFKLTSETTPHVFEAVSVGPHAVQVLRDEIPYVPERFELTLEDGDSKAVHFTTPPSLVTPFDLGRSDILEVGAFAWSPFGNSFVYAATTTEFGVGIYNRNYDFIGEQDAILLTADVNIREPVDIYNRGASLYLVWTSATGELLEAQLFDAEFDGFFAMAPAQTILGSGYGAAISQDKLLYSASPSSGHNGLRWATIDADSVEVWQTAAEAGGWASWKPGSIDYFVFEQDGLLMRGVRADDILLAPDTLRTQGTIRFPAWGPRSIVYLTGTDFGTVSMQFETGSLPAVLADGLVEGRTIAWHPNEPFLVVTHNPGGGAAIRVENLPFPTTP